jgi:hypothetical protein
MADIKKKSLSLTKKTTVNDENLFRDLALKIVNTMPFDELSKLIQFKKIHSLKVN